MGTGGRRLAAGAFDLPTGNSRSPPTALRRPRLARIYPAGPLDFLHRMRGGSRQDLRDTSPRIGQGHTPTFPYTHYRLCFARTRATARGDFRYRCADPGSRRGATGSLGSARSMARGPARSAFAAGWRVPHDATL